jgi:hypothetical protein
MDMDIVQRCRYLENNKPKGKKVSDIFPQDYMGSAEFEFGAKPTSLRRMWHHYEQYEVFSVDINGTQVWCWAKPEQKDFIVQSLTDYINHKTRWKEFTSFDDTILKARPASDDNFWWDLENDFVFSLIEKAVKQWAPCLANSITYMNSKGK